jgi:hypothetical protein
MYEVWVMGQPRKRGTGLAPELFDSSLGRERFLQRKHGGQVKIIIYLV